MTDRPPEARADDGPAGVAGSLLTVPIRRQWQAVSAAPAQAMAEPPLPAGIIDYWQACRPAGGDLPARRDIDGEAVARCWPNTLLVACRGAHLHFEERLGAAQSAQEAEIATMAVEWLLALCDETARRRTPLEKSDLFPTSLGDMRLFATALPLAADGFNVDHILCHLRRGD